MISDIAGRIAGLGNFRSEISDFLWEHLNAHPDKNASFDIPTDAAILLGKELYAVRHDPEKRELIFISVRNERFPYSYEFEINFRFFPTKSSGLKKTEEVVNA